MPKFIFSSLNDRIHIDEKWFYVQKINKKLFTKVLRHPNSQDTKQIIHEKGDVLVEVLKTWQKQTLQF